MGNKPSVKSRMKNGFINGGTCTKAGENALQAICGEFDSHLLHKREKRKVIITAAVSSNWSERRRHSRRLQVRALYGRGKILKAVKGSVKVVT